MKTLIITALIAFPLFFSAQTLDRESVDSHEVRKGFYGNLNINSISPFDETYNFGLGGGMHFSENFHIGLTYLGGKGQTGRVVSDSLLAIDENRLADLKYKSFGIELGYEIPLHQHFSIMPYFNQSTTKYEYEVLPGVDRAKAKDNFLNTLIGAKFFFVANENLRLGLNLSYGMANGVNLYQTKSADLTGLNAGLTLQYNHFLPKW